MTEDPLFVSPYLMLPLRSYADALRDREKSAATRGASAKDSVKSSRPSTKATPSLSREGRATTKTEEDPNV